MGGVNRTFWRNPTNPIGVDVGASSVKLLQLRHGRAGTHVLAAARVAFEEPLPDSPEERRRIIGDAVRSALTMAPFHGRTCVSSMLASDLLIRAARLPRLSDEELTKAAHWEAADRFAVELNDIQVDWVRAGEIVQGDDSRDEVILIAARREVVNSHLDALIDCRLLPLAVEIPPAANIRILNRMLRRDVDRSVVRMIIDVGATETSVVITRGQEIAFLKPISIGGREMTASVAKALDLDPAAAAQLRFQRMTANDTGSRAEIDDRVDRAVFEAVRPQMHDIAQETALCLRYYSVTFRGVRPELVLVVGGDGAEPGLCQVLEETLNISTELGKPLDGIDVSSVTLGVDRRRSSWPEWSVAAGLSLRGGDRVARAPSAPAIDATTSDEDELRRVVA